MYRQGCRRVLIEPGGGPEGQPDIWSGLAGWGRKEEPRGGDRLPAWRVWVDNPPEGFSHARTEGVLFRPHRLERIMDQGEYGRGYMDGLRGASAYVGGLVWFKAWALCMDKVGALSIGPDGLANLMAKDGTAISEPEPPETMLAALEARANKVRLTDMGEALGSWYDCFRGQAKAAQYIRLVIAYLAWAAADPEERGGARLQITQEGGVEIADTDGAFFTSDPERRDQPGQAVAWLEAQG